MLIEALKALLIGLVEGITEWLPISSTGHMILVDEFVKLQVSDSFLALFLVVIQIGAIMAVIILYFHKLNPFAPSKSAGQKKETWILWLKVILSIIPSGLVGILLDDWMDAHLYNSVVVAIMLIVYGVAFILIERRPRVPTTTKLSRITYKQAILVGAWQVLALIPGTSRSGSTILGGMLCGMSRPAASQFTFFLAIPVMAGASLLKLVKFFGKGNSFTLDQTVVLIVGCAVAFIVSIIAIRFLMDYVKRHTFTAFGVYRIALGIVVLVIWGVQTFVLKAPAAV